MPVFSIPEQFVPELARGATFAGKEGALASLMEALAVGQRERRMLGVGDALDMRNALYEALPEGLSPHLQFGARPAASMLTHGADALEALEQTGPPFRQIPFGGTPLVAFHPRHADALLSAEHPSLADALGAMMERGVPLMAPEQQVAVGRGFGGHGRIPPTPFPIPEPGTDLNRLLASMLRQPHRAADEAGAAMLTDALQENLDRLRPQASRAHAGFLLDQNYLFPGLQGQLEQGDMRAPDLAFNFLHMLSPRFARARF